ncbi:restriction endonuclease [bacterium]|nr:restriction endonuclease [bacterium]
MSLISTARKQFHATLINSILFTNQSGVPTNADKASRISIDIAKSILEQLKRSSIANRLPGQSSGNQFEQIVQQFTEATFPALSNLRPGVWHIDQVTGKRLTISDFEQFVHLDALDRAARENAELATALGNDYFIKPDIVVSRSPENDEFINGSELIVDTTTSNLTPLRSVNTSQKLLHASISCKWTLRSDRAQNARSEGLNLVKNRKGSLPHIVVVTGEPVPARIASLALGTGEIDMVYHFALPELQVACQNFPDAAELIEIMINGKRLKDISDLPFDLAI